MAITPLGIGNNTSTSDDNSIVITTTVAAAVGDQILVLISAANTGTNGAAPVATVADSDGVNVYTQRASINFDPGAAGAGATLLLFDCPATDALSIGATITATFDVNVAQKCIRAIKFTPGASEAISRIAVDTTGQTDNATTHAANTVAVTSGDCIVAAAAIETDDTVTGDADTTNGSWTGVNTFLADGGADASTMSLHSAWKVATGTGDQSWACTTATGRDSARTYIVYRSAADTVDDLLANDVSSASSVTAPAIGQVHVLNAADLASASSVGAPALGQVHALLANDVASASSVTSPAVGQIHALTADDLVSASSVTAPTLAEADSEAVAVDTHDGGYEWESAEEIRSRLRRLEQAQEQGRRKRVEADRRLTEELDKAYRRLVLHEPERAAEVVEAVKATAPKAIKGTLGTDRLPTIDWRKLSNAIATTEAVLASLERDRRAIASEEDDIEILLLTAA